MRARIRTGLVIIVFVAFWALLLRDFINWLRGPPIDWSLVADQIAEIVSWGCLLVVLYPVFRGWRRLTNRLRRFGGR